ncbi:MAG TPA: putative toxin-antitoxin system toxin component, PIN family [Candidatus Cybelea sp.]|nr:putative toxin-antitoxin system toxin component, PIN family [Candidatus Cybelea sp.]
MTTEARIVLDTNTLVSYFLATESVPGQAVRKAEREAILLASQETLDELAEVLSRRKFDAYASLTDRKTFVKLIAAAVEIVPITAIVRACRDPKDDKFLEVALNGSADLIITGDKDLLALDPFHEVRIIRPARYLTE